jgi:hypothetical protein
MKYYLSYNLVIEYKLANLSLKMSNFLPSKKSFSVSFTNNEVKLFNEYYKYISIV